MAYLAWAISGGELARRTAAPTVLGPAFVLLAVVLVTFAWRRARRRKLQRNLEILQRFEGFVRSRFPALELASVEKGYRIETPEEGNAAVLANSALLDAWEADQRKPHPAGESVFETQLALAARPPQAFSGPFRIKGHGSSLVLRLFPSGWYRSVQRRLQPAVVPLPQLELVATYSLPEGNDLRFVTEEHLAEEALTANDLHGVCLAFLRQRLDEEEIRRARTGDVAQRVGSGGPESTANLLLLSEVLEAEGELYAQLPSQEELWLSAAPQFPLWVPPDRPQIPLLGDAIVCVNARGFRLRKTGGI